MPERLKNYCYFTVRFRGLNILQNEQIAPQIGPDLDQPLELGCVPRTPHRPATPLLDTLSNNLGMVRTIATHSLKLKELVLSSNFTI